jgi:multidrug efflux pump subunit AcrA (membrane-fusion protein)
MNIDKKKLRKILYVYLSLMLVLIFSSRTIYNLTLPRVAVAMPQSGRLTKELEARGVISFYETYEIYAASSGQIDEIFIEKGDLIDANTVIATFKAETSGVGADAAEAGFSIERIENQLSGLILNRNSILQAIEKAKENVFDDHIYQRNIQEASITLERRRAELRDARNLLAEARRGNSSEFDDDGYQDAIEDARAQVRQAGFLVDDAQRAYENAVYDLNRASAAFIMDAESAVKALELELQRAELDIARANIDLRAVRASSASDSGMAITSDYQGVVISIEKSKGQFVAQGEKVATVGVNNNLFTAEITVADSDGRFIEIGDKANIFKSGSSRAIIAVVSDIVPVGDALRISLICETEEFSGGEYVTVKFQKQTQLYHYLVPNEAIFSEGMGSFVWIVQSRQGALGIEYFTSRVRVLIADSDDFYTAISRGLESFAPVVVSHDRDLAVNGRVQRME